MLLAPDAGFGAERGRLWRLEGTLGSAGSPGDDDSSSRGGSSWDWEEGRFVADEVDVSRSPEAEAGRSCAFVRGDESIVSELGAHSNRTHKVFVCVRVCI